MGPCFYCKQMIYLDWIAERGYHRECHERFLQVMADKKAAELAVEAHKLRATREQEKRRLRRAAKRIEEKRAQRGVENC